MFSQASAYIDDDMRVAVTHHTKAALHCDKGNANHMNVTAHLTVQHLLCAAGMKKKTGSSSFNGLHLRLEVDAAAWIRLVGGEEFFWETHFEAMTNATFTTEQPLVMPYSSKHPWHPHTTALTDLIAPQH
jgi:hypothetical protein